MDPFPAPVFVTFDPFLKILRICLSPFSPTLRIHECNHSFRLSLP